jgi:hypothetical protein
VNKRSGSDVLVAKTSFWATVGKRQVLVHQGDTASPGHPIVVGREEMFEPLRVKFNEDPPRIEQATAAPGERRGQRTA